MWAWRLKAAARRCPSMAGWAAGTAEQCDVGIQKPWASSSSCPGGAMRGYVLDPLLRKQWPCRSPIHLPAPPAPPMSSLTY